MTQDTYRQVQEVLLNILSPSTGLYLQSLFIPQPLKFWPLCTGGRFFEVAKLAQNQISIIQTDPWEFKNSNGIEIHLQKTAAVLVNASRLFEVPGTRS